MQAMPKPYSTRRTFRLPRRLFPWLRTPLCATAVAMLLTACASGPRVLDSQVQSVATAGSSTVLRPGLRYRFERLPLEAGHPGADRVDMLAQQALAGVGLVHDPANARITVQAGAQANTYWVDEWGTPWPGVYGPRYSNARLSLYMGSWGRHGGFTFGAPLWWDTPTPVYLHEVRLLMRDMQGGQVLYETRARHDGSSGSTDRILSALFTAALQGFPNPPLGWHTVRVPLPPPPGTAPSPGVATPASQAAPAATAPAAARTSPDSSRPLNTPVAPTTGSLPAR